MADFFREIFWSAWGLVSIVGAAILFGIYFGFCAGKIRNINKEIETVINAQNINAAFEETKLLKVVWKNFEKTLTRTSGKIYSTADAAEFFNTQSLTRGMNMTFWQAYGGIFTGLGILGTFAGLTFGLSGVDMTSGNIETLKGGIAQLLSGVESAFVTSLVGIACAIIYSFIHHALLKNFQSKVNTLAEKLDEIFPRYSAENWLSDIKGESQNQTAELKSIGGQVVTENSWLEKSYVESQNQTAELKSIGGQVATENSWLEKSYVESQNQTAELQNIGTDIGSQKAILQNIGEDVAQAIFNGLDEKIGIYVDKICEAIDKLGQGAAEGLNDTMSKVAGAQMDRFSTALEKFSDNIDEKLKNATEISKIMNEQLLNTLKELNESLKQQAKTSADERDAEYKKFSETLEGLIDTLNAVADKIKVQQTETAADFEKLVKDLLNNFNVAMAKILADAQKDSEDKREERRKEREEFDRQNQNDYEQRRAASEQFLSTLATLNKTLEDLAGKIKSQQEGTLGNFETLINKLISNLNEFTLKQQRFLDSTAKSNSTQISEAVKAFREIVDNHNATTKKTFAQVQNHLAETEKFLQSMGAASYSLKQAAEPVKQSTLQLTKNLSETSAQVSKLANANQQTRQNLLELSDKLKTFVNNFNGIANELETSSNVIKNSLENYNSKMNDGMTKNLNEFDKRISDAVGHLSVLVEDLSNALDDFNRKRR